MMKTLSAPDPRRTTRFIFALLAMALTVAACAISAQTQPSPTSTTRVEALRSQIVSATDRHASAEELGTLWLRLGDEYQRRFELAQAEDAFTRSVSLLRSSATQPVYADSLEGLGLLYFETGRPAEAENCMRKALGMYETLGDRARTAVLHESIAMGLVFERRFREGEAESFRAIGELQAQSQPDLVEMAEALVTHSYALCFQGRCKAALEDADRAMAVAQSVLPAESTAIVAVWLARGFDLWKSGSVEEGGAALREAIRIVNDRTDLPHPLLVNSQLVVLRQYAAYLKATHRKPQAALMEAEIRQLESERTAVCDRCTIDAAALSH
jgi:tetratricopeptide (TPR) repeat protein